MELNRQENLRVALQSTSSISLLSKQMVEGSIPTSIDLTDQVCFN